MYIQNNSSWINITLFSSKHKILGWMNNNGTPVIPIEVIIINAENNNKSIISFLDAFLIIYLNSNSGIFIFIIFFHSDIYL